MTRVQTVLDNLNKRTDILLAGFVIAIIFMMILPMPTWLVDALIAINFLIAIVVLMISIYIQTPLALSTFPTILLLSTLFRLALSITTTRLILLQADAGDIVITFGNFVVGGNIVVGIVIFAIITVVQFIVITKGSERVAEVSARFSLDGMPGKQMSIDGDMRAGVIDSREASRRRVTLAKESQLYGSMDGAMKFVKGDAVAGIFIILINIIGGISIGMFQRGMSMGEAGHIYTILTVGDGLVSQIPALFMAITSGIIVTRVNSEQNRDLGRDIGTQVFAQPKAMLIGSAVLLLFSAIPGFPTEIFIFLGLLLLSVGGSLLVLQKRAEETGSDFIDAVESAKNDIISTGTGDSVGLATPLSLHLNVEMQKLIRTDILNRELGKIRHQLYLDLGVPFPGVHIYYSNAQEPGRYGIYLHEVPVAYGAIRNGYVLVKQSPQELQTLGLEAEDCVEPLFNGPLAWVKQSDCERLYEKDIGYLDINQVLTTHLSKILRLYADEFVGTQEASRLLDQTSGSCSDLLREMRAIVPLQMVGEVLKRLVAEGVSIRDLRNISEALLRYGKDEKDPGVLVEHARIQLRRQISFQYSDSLNTIKAVVLDSATEDLLRNHIQQGPHGEHLALPPDKTQELIDTVKRTFETISDKIRQPILFAPQDVRRFVHKVLHTHLPNIAVLSYLELVPEIQVEMVERIGIE